MEAKTVGAEEQMEKVRSVVGADMPEAKIIQALSLSQNDSDAAIDLLAPQATIQRTVTGTGFRVSAHVKEEQIGKLEPSERVDGSNPPVGVKEEQIGKLEPPERIDGSNPPVRVKEEPDGSLDTPLVPKSEVSTTLVKQETTIVPEEAAPVHDGSAVKVEAKEGGPLEEVGDSGCLNVEPVSVFAPIKDVLEVSGNEFERSRGGANVGRRDSHSTWNTKKEATQTRIVSDVGIENGDFPEESDWFLVGRTVVTALSTTRGSKLADNEVVHFAFPSTDSVTRLQWKRSKASAALSGIVRFSTKRYGEIGRLPIEWSKSLIPLVNSSKVKVLGRCVAAPSNLHLMEEVMLYVSLYVHVSIFAEGYTNKSSWKTDAPSNIDATLYPLPTLLSMLNITPYQKAEFTPGELDSRKRSLNLGGGSADLSLAKRRKGDQQCPVPEQNKDEQAFSESSLNKLVGSADAYNLEEMEPPRTLTCRLKSYQKQALYWMTQSEKGIDVEKAARTLHPCWAEYRICDERISSLYVNIFTGEATIDFPTATQMTRGGILADAMGLGKTVMTIALLLARQGRGSTQKNKHNAHVNGSPQVRGGTLVVCPMALLGQWKDELETHSEPDSISIFVHYGGFRTNDAEVMADHDVVLTTYGVLNAAFKHGPENSIFHRVEWYRVVLDEAHTIKASRTQSAQAAFALSSYCRWCLTGTPLQNSLEDLYSLLCFLHVEPWCNWAWWSKLIQKPYECGDQRGLRLIKAILRTLMLRRTKETKDNMGRPILTLPPVDIQIVECNQSEAEHHFYNALFRRSQIQFDKFVAEGKVLNNYANILELLLRLRQCCNHPFLVMSQADSQKYTDIDELARRFLQASSNAATASSMLPTRAYVEEVVEDIRKGENMECPICLEYADDPVITPCAHRMCRECLLASWRSRLFGPCPICRRQIREYDLLACPSDNGFSLNDENWRESSKVSELLDCLVRIRQSGSGEKSIVFSQWTSFFDLLEVSLRNRGIEFLRFDGKLAQKQREVVLKEFNHTEEKMVLLMSLKAGGVGLNLTAASNVFIMDPWWNPAVEEQAIMRIHRIGQNRTVKVRRFIVKDTVEERLQQIQARKQRMVAGALTDEEIRGARIEELKMLFR